MCNNNNNNNHERKCITEETIHESSVLETQKLPDSDYTTVPLITTDWEVIVGIVYEVFKAQLLFNK